VLSHRPARVVREISWKDRDISPEDIF